MPSSQSGFSTTCTGRPASSAAMSPPRKPVTTSTGPPPARAARATRLSRVSPSLATSCLGVPSRLEAPAARMTEGTTARDWPLAREEVIACPCYAFLTDLET